MNLKTGNNLTFPDVSQLMPHQIKVLSDPHRFQTIIWHRRARKTTTGIIKLLCEALNPDIPPSVNWFIMPTFGQAKMVAWQDPSMFFRICPPEVIEKINETELNVFLRNGSIVSFKGSDNPETLRGANPRMVVMDEYAEMKPATWDSIVQPILRGNNGLAWFISTPKGRNHLYKNYLKGLGGEDPEWSSSILPASQSGVLSGDQLRAAKADMPEGLYNQEFECEFLSGEGSVFRGINEAATAIPRQPKSGEIYVMGCDLGKARDYTSISIFSRRNNEQVYQNRFRKFSWVFQKRKIAETARFYNHAVVILDVTGLGSPVADDLSRAGVGVIPYPFTSRSKKELIEKLSIYLEQGRIKILPDKQLIEELSAFSYTLSPQGNVQYSAPEGQHDDTVVSLALACSHLFPVSKQESRSKPPSLIAAYYKRLTAPLEDWDPERLDLDYPFGDEWYSD